MSTAPMTLAGRWPLPDHHDLRDELLTAARWTVTHDPSPGYRSLLVEALRQLEVEDADAWLD